MLQVPNLEQQLFPAFQEVLQNDVQVCARSVHCQLQLCLAACCCMDLRLQEQRWWSAHPQQLCLVLM